MTKGVRILVFVMLILALSLPAVAQTPITAEDLLALQESYQQLLSQGNPEREVQTVYSINPWNGSGVGTGTFAHKDVDTIYVIADETNLVNVRKTEVYYWPITREYQANWFEMNETIEGKLRIRQGDKVIATLEPETYVDYYPEGSMGERELVLGDEGVALYEEYERLYDEYIEEARKYYDEQLAYQREVEAILRQVNETGEYVAEDEVPKAPRQPTAPTMFVYPPRTAYVLDLPEGRYQIELIDDSGRVIEGTQKNLEAFTARRAGLGYSVLPEDKWTKAFPSNNPQEVFYLDGRRIFYLQPIEVEEYNMYKFYKSQNLHQPLYGEGSRSSWVWVQTAPADTDLKLQILRDGEVVQEVKRTPFYVRQTDGYGLGYHIIEFDPDDPIMFGKAPSFYGYRLDLEVERGSYTMQMVDGEGNVIPSSVREIRSVRLDTGWAMYGTPLIPLLLGVVVFIRRMRLRPRSGRQDISA